MSDTSKDSLLSKLVQIVAAIAGSVGRDSNGARVNSDSTAANRFDSFESKLKTNQKKSEDIAKNKGTDTTKKFVELDKISKKRDDMLVGQISRIDAKLTNTISRVGVIERGFDDLGKALKKLSKDDGRGEFNRGAITKINDHEKRIKILESFHKDPNNGANGRNGSSDLSVGKTLLSLLKKGGPIGLAITAALIGRGIWNNRKMLGDIIANSQEAKDFRKWKSDRNDVGQAAKDLNDIRVIGRKREQEYDREMRAGRNTPDYKRRMLQQGKQKMRFELWLF